MQFKNVIAEAGAKKRLLQSVASGRISHAQLFLGNEGCGHLPLALAFAQYVNCMQPSETDSCGRCNSCIKSQKHIHPDIHYTYPTVGSKEISRTFIKDWRKALDANPYMNVFEWLQFINAENKQGNITASECQDILKKLSYTKAEGKYKTQIVWMPEYLGNQGNRLLKLIEEPPENTLFILVAENQDQILNTIISRTQSLKVPNLNDEALAKILQKNHNLTETLALQIAALSEGNYNTVRALMSQNNNEFKDLLLNWLNACLYKEVSTISNFVEASAALGRERQKHFIKYALHFLRQALLMNFLPNANSALSKQEKSLAEKLMNHFSQEDLEYITGLLNDAYEYISRNANPRVLFFNLSIKLMDVMTERKMAF